MAATPEKAGTEIPGSHHEDPGFPPFKTETFGGQVLWLAITFGALLYAMHKFIIPRLRGIFEHRHSTIRNDLEGAAADKAKAEEVGRAYEAAMAKARAEAEELGKKAHDELMTASEARRRALEADLLKQMQDAEAKIAATKAKAMMSVRDVAADAAAEIVKQLTGKAPPAAAVETALGKVGN